MLKFMRISLVSTWYLTTLLLVFIISLFRPFNTKNAHLFCQIGPRICRHWLGIKIIEKNLKNLTQAQPCVYIANHQNILDIIFLAAVFPQNSVVIGKKAVRWIPLFGWVFWLSGHLLVERKDFTKAMSTMGEAQEAIEKRGVSIWLFPEGTRSEGRGLLPFKKGAFHLAIDAQVPIVPIVASAYFGKLNLNKPNAGTVTVEALPPIETKGKTKDDVDDLLNQAHKLFENQLAAQTQV
ncbi:MAG: 1-acylglycerol-3-phosphate O-acyltransferase [Bdellovibrionales bacterium]|nr:1-acylglycerol-3-phosphate O-acyltransferase [Bdellovibrionales bacterium]